MKTCMLSYRSSIKIKLNIRITNQQIRLHMEYEIKLKIFMGYKIFHKIREPYIFQPMNIKKQVHSVNI